MRAAFAPFVASLALFACDASPDLDRRSASRVGEAVTATVLDADSLDIRDIADSLDPRDIADSLDLRDIEDTTLADTATPTDTTAPADTNGPGDTTTPGDTTAPGDTVGPGDTTSSPLGTPADPILIDRLPYVVEVDTATATSDVLDRYTCATADESGPELVHRLEVTAAGALTVEVLEDDGVDLDLHLLDVQPPTTRSAAVACVTRANTRLTTTVTPGTYWLVVDTYVNASGPQLGAARLAVELAVDDAWQVIEVAPGVIWKKKVYADYAGGRQTINVLDVDPSAPGVSLRPYLKPGGGCVRPSTVGPAQGALAAINAGFFDTGPGTCPALDLVKANGQVLAYNRLTGAAQRAIGWDAAGDTQVAWVDANTDWPAVIDGLGSYPSLVTDGSILIEPDKDTDFFDARHPRSALGVTADGRVLLVTVDGRTSAGAGMTLAALAQHMIHLGATQAVNLDGGGSTALWIDGMSINGVVNHPSDNGAADHWGERGVSDLLMVFVD